MSSYPSYDKGDWEVLCDSCGRKFKASKLRLRWDGLRVCSQDYEVRHPQDFVRAKVDIQAVPWARPEPQDTFIPGLCTLNGRSAIAGYAITGCSIVGRTVFDPSIDRIALDYYVSAVAGIAIAGITPAGYIYSENPSI